MTQEERLEYLLRTLLAEQPSYREPRIPMEKEEKKRLLRALFNVRPPWPISGEFLRVQDAYLREETLRKGITDAAGLSPVRKGLYLWRGDITALRADAIVNAANSRLLGCFVPGHHCIDNAIHTYAGVQLRLACADLMARQGHEEPAGRAKLTPAFNLPSRYVLHTVGPIVTGGATEKDAAQLRSCYRSCLELAEEQGAESIAFCCISTGEFRYPNEEAAGIAVGAVEEYLRRTKSGIRVIFNVYKETDESIYRRLLGGGC